MRCRSCDKNLNDYESTRKDENGEYLDLCNTCREISFYAAAELDEDFYEYDIGLDKNKVDKW